MTSPRRIAHPGPEAAERTRVVPCGAVPVTLRLEPGRSVLEEATAALAAEGFEAAYLSLAGARFDPMRYVIPAGAPGDGHAAWYSETFAPDGVCTVEIAGLHVGRRDGEPFLHCHGIWSLPDGTQAMGHLLPHDSVLAKAVEVTGFGLDGAILDVEDDPETRFRLFQPVARQEHGRSTAEALLCTIRPNTDVTEAIAEICRKNGIDQASLHGIGSLVGADFEDGEHLASYATELLIREGAVTPGDTGPHTSLDIALVGMDGTIAEGRLVPGRNPVCVTFELLVVRSSAG
ncbi:DUF296 domain-containing protein [Amorphus sp. 3PC139-8]|uniref:PCC domain-containing protein n=1 Tax=Amorphus sp. 3PC139-8 TaxID=2735676 RepID=UPI00345E00AF